MDILKVLIVLSVIALFGTITHIGYKHATSYECQVDIPPKPFINKTTGEEYYIGNPGFEGKYKCRGGVLAKFPIN